MLVLKQVSKTFGSVAALRAIDLTVEPGRIHALIGHNGSGKSTLIKILAGFHNPDPGAEATFNGRPLRLGDAHSASGRAALRASGSRSRPHARRGRQRRARCRLRTPSYRHDQLGAPGSRY